MEQPHDDWSPHLLFLPPPPHTHTHSHALMCTSCTQVLIFALYKKEAARLEGFLQYKGYNVRAIHGDLSQVRCVQEVRACVCVCVCVRVLCACVDLARAFVLLRKWRSGGAVVFSSSSLHTRSRVSTPPVYTSVVAFFRASEAVFCTTLRAGRCH